MKMAKLLLPAAAALLCGCFTPSRSFSSYERELNRQVSEMQAPPSLDENGTPVDPVVFYQDYVRGHQLLPLPDYREKLVVELQRLDQDRSYVLSFDAVLSSQYFFHKRLWSLVAADVMLARLYSAQGKYREADETFAAAQELVNSRAASRYFAAKLSAQLSNELLTLYGKSGERGKALNAKLSASLLGDYLVSPGGVADFCAEKQAAVNSRDEVARINSYISDINSQRILQGKALQLINTISTSAYTAAQSTAAITPAQALQSAVARSSGAANPQPAPANPVIAEQLLTASLAVNTPTIVTEYAKAAVALAPADTALKKQADSLVAQAARLDALRGLPLTRKTFARIKYFTQSLAAFQNQVNTLR